MKYLSGFFIWILVLAARPMLGRPMGDSAVDEPQLANIRIDREIMDEDKPVAWILQDVLRGTGVPGGFAELTGCSDLPKGRLNLKPGATLPDAMNTLVAANPNYRWWLELGVVNLIPREGVPLLGTKIGNFQMDATDREIPAVLQDLVWLPEVQKRAAELGLKPGFGQGGPSAVPLHPVPREPVPIHISLQNLSLRDALNKVVQSSGHMIWIYHERDCNAVKTYTVETASGY